MNKMDSLIAREIILAQVSSDGGKGIGEIERIFSDSLPVNREGYKNKERHILRAISLISKSKESKFRFFVTKDGKCPLVYFDYKGDSTRLQVSFHCPYSTDVEKWMTKRDRKSYSTKWDRLSSREACKALWVLIQNSL